MGLYIGYKLKKATTNTLRKSNDTISYYERLFFELCSGKTLNFIYKSIIEYQYVGDTKISSLQVIDSKQRLKPTSEAIQLSLIQRSMLQISAKKSKRGFRQNPAQNLKQIMRKKRSSSVMVLKLNLLSKKHDYPFSFNNEVFGKYGEKKNRKNKDHFQQDIRMPESIQ